MDDVFEIGKYYQRGETKLYIAGSCDGFLMWSKGCLLGEDQHGNITPICSDKGAPLGYVETKSWDIDQ